MESIAFATTNAEKLLIAQHICEAAGLKVTQVSLEIDEIQGEDPEAIIRDKATRAYDQYQSPIIVSDDSWSVPALGGFPGAYMKSMNYWLKAEDWVRLMQGVEDRSIFLHQYLAYNDGNEITIFSHDIPGVIIDGPRGKSKKSPSMTMVALDSDGGKSIAEIFDAGQAGMEERYKTRRDAWHEFTKWYKERYA